MESENFFTNLFKKKTPKDSRLINPYFSFITKKEKREEEEQNSTIYFEDSGGRRLQNFFSPRIVNSPVAFNIESIDESSLFQLSDSNRKPEISTPKKPLNTPSKLIYRGICSTVKQKRTPPSGENPDFITP